MFAMVALGIGQILGSFYTGFIVDRCGSRIASQQNCLNLALALASVALYLSRDTYIPALAYFMTFMWGF